MLHENRRYRRVTVWMAGACCLLVLVAYYYHFTFMMKPSTDDGEESIAFLLPNRSTSDDAVSRGSITESPIMKESVTENPTVGSENMLPKYTFCVQDRRYPRSWHTMDLDADQKKNSISGDYILWPGTCQNYCIAFCTNVSSYNEDHCTMGQYGNSTYCIWNRLATRQKNSMQVGDTCTATNFCCPHDRGCSDKDTGEFADFNSDNNNVVYREARCPSFCSFDYDCCDEDWCDMGLGEVESNNGRCTRERRRSRA